jgi:two-component system, OmpR family, alkaline phosphatase synthesis response regulator PhoP
MKVLVVEDDRSIQMVLELVLTKVSKCDVIVASEGREGLAKIIEQKPDVVLLDLMLPGIDGFEICQQAKANESTRHIPIIFLTAQPQPSAVARAMALGAAGYIVKPFDPIKIIDQINEALTRVQAPRLA